MRRLHVFVVLLLVLLAVAPAPAQQGFVTLVPTRTAAIVNGTTTVSTLTLGTATGIGLGTVLVNISAGSAVTGTMQLFIEDSSDGGTTWDDVIASNTFAFGAAAITQRFFLTSDLLTTATQGTAAAVETLAAGTVRSGPYGDRLRVREKISAIAGSPVGPTYTITAVFK